MAVDYPTYPVTTLAQAEDMIIFTGNQIHDIMNADATSVIEAEDGAIPSIRKALVDNMYFKTPQIWVASTQVTDPLQLKQFTDGGWYFAPTATVSSPVNLGVTPIGDTNWKPWSKDQAAVYQHAKRLAAEAGYNMVSGSFYFGGTLDSVDDVLFYEGDGKYYSWSGAFPKVVSAGSTPATSGGVGAGAWVDRTDVSLRAEITPSVTEALRRSYADAGYNLVDGSFESGGTLTNTNDVLLHKASGIAYSWAGAFPKVVPAGSTPSTSGGIGINAWVDRTDLTLRAEIPFIFAAISKSVGYENVYSLKTGTTVDSAKYFVATGGIFPSPTVLKPVAADLSVDVASGEITNFNLSMSPCPSATIGGKLYYLLNAEHIKTNYVNIDAYHAKYIETDAQWREICRLLSSLTKSNMVIDFNNYSFNIEHDGVDFDAPVSDDSDNSHTSYLKFSLVDNITIKNADISSSVDMTTHSERMITCYGCVGVTLDNVRLNLTCSGYPIFSVNGFETHGTLVDFRNYDDGVTARSGSGLTIKGNCKFRVYHPNGHSVGDGTGNPVHPTYAGKLEGINFYGTYDASSPVWMRDLLIEDGAEFYQTTARAVWCWVYKDITIGDIIFRDCGDNSSCQMYFGVRLVHGGQNVKVGDLSFINCNLYSGLYLTNNNGNYHPENVKIGTMSFSNCQGSTACHLADGLNVEIEQINLSNSPLERGALLSSGGSNRMKNLTINGVSASGVVGRMVTILGDFWDNIEINSIHGKPIETQVATGIYGVYIENYGTLYGTDSKLKLKGLKIDSYSVGVYVEASTTSPVDIDDFEILNSIQDAIVYSTLSGQYSKITNGTLIGNGGRGMRVPRYGIAKNIIGRNNASELVQLMTGSIIDGYDVDDGALTTGSAISIVSGETGWVIKNGTLKSSSGKFIYGINAPQVGYILHNDFIGTVGTSGKWSTFGGTSILGNTPTNTL